MLDGDCDYVFRERHGFVLWKEVLGGKSLVHGCIFVASSGVQDDHKFLAWVAIFSGGRRFYGEIFVRFEKVR